MGVYTYASISMHSTKSRRRTVIRSLSSQICSMLQDLPGYIRKSIQNMHTTLYILQRETNPKWHSEPIMDHSNGELCPLAYPMPQQPFNNSSMTSWETSWMSVQ